MELKTTPLIEEHRKLSAKLGPFGGWLMPISYEGIIIEHNWTRMASSVFDVCHMGELLVHGDPAGTRLEKIVTVKLDGMPLNKCRYGFILDENGMIIDDIIVYRTGEKDWMIVVNAATRRADAEHVRKHLSGAARFEDVSGGVAKLDIQGPFSGEVLSAMFGDGIKKLGYYSFGYFDVMGEKNVISRTGYTGELGYEVYVSSGRAAELWRTILKDERVRPAGLGARDTLRLEMCYPLYGQDIGASVTPIEAGFESFLDFGKDFIGKDALLRKKAQGPKAEMAFFLADSRRAPRHDFKVYSGDAEIGTVTSGTFSPSLSRGIGMGYIDAQYNLPGTNVVLKGGKIEITASLTDKPFYKTGSARAQVGQPF